MTASIMASFLEHSEKNSNMFNYSSSLEGHQLTSVPCSSASHSSCPPTEPLQDGKAVGAPSAGGPFERCHPVSLPDAKFSQNQFFSRLNTDSSALLSSNKENCFRERSYSETGEGLRSSIQMCAGGNGHVNSSRYKTELCRPFQEHGSCKYGDKCQFAHGSHELRSLSRHPKYKTELCRTFHYAGFCPYGPRCHFIHNAEERRGPPPLSAFNKPQRPRLQHSFSFAGFPSSGSPQDTPTSLTPPTAFSTEDLSQDPASLVCPGLGPLLAFEPQGLTPSSPPTPCFIQSVPERPPSPPDLLPDQEGYQSSQSSSDSPLLDPSHRLPIFSRLSISD